MFLVIEDDFIVARSLKRVLRRHAPVAVARTAAEAIHLLNDVHRYWGAIIDVMLPDGSGLEVLRALRPRAPQLPVLIYTAHGDRGCIEQAQLLGAQYLPKPVGSLHVDAFARASAAWQLSAGERRFAAALDELVRRHGLTTRQAEIVRWVAAGTSPSDLPQCLGVTRNTIKTLVRRLLERCDAERLDDIVRPLQWQAFGHLFCPPASKNPPPRP
jgi:DNA-binding NarL/FixJ family response regulator